MVDEDEIIKVAKLMKIDLDDHSEHIVRVKKMLEYFDILDKIDLSSEELDKEHDNSKIMAKRQKDLKDKHRKSQYDGQD